jgi:hypothetical protein
MANDLNNLLDYLLHTLHAYQDLDHKGKGLRNAVKTKLRWWSKAQEGITTIPVPVRYEELWKRARVRNQQLYLEETLKQDWHTFPVLQSTNTHLRIEDPRGHLLAYRLRIPQHYTDTLQQTESLIPPQPTTAHKRGLTNERHWGLWKKYMPHPKMTKDFTRDLPYSQQWLEANQGLFHYLSDILRLLEPQMYVRYTSIRQFLPPDVQPVCGAWYACAIHQGMVTDGEEHLDQSDYYCGLNVVTGWGEFTSAKLLLWQLGLAVEVKPGDAIFFLSRMITHNAVDIQGGVRNIIDVFVHQAPLKWKDDQLQNLTGYQRKERRRKGKGKQQDSGSSEGKGKEKQQKQDAQPIDPDTEEEMEAMYESGEGLYELRLGEVMEDSD